MDPRLLPPQEVPGWMGGALSSNAPKFLSGGYVDGQLQDNTAWANSDGTVTWVIGGQPQIMSRSAWDAEIQRQVANDRGLMGSLMEIGTQFVLPAVGAYYGLSGLDGLLNKTAALPASEVSALTPAAETAATTTAANTSSSLLSPEVLKAASGLGTVASLAGAADGMLADNATVQAAIDAASQNAGGSLIPNYEDMTIPSAYVSNTTPSAGMLSTIAKTLGMTESDVAKLGSGALNTIGGLLASSANKSTAQTQANAQIEAARIAAEAAKFKPIGVTTRFGQSQFTKDANGNVIGAGYQLTPDVKAQQDRLMAMSGGLLGQYEGAQAATAPMGAAAQRAMQLGQGYLATDPAAQAQKYMAEQQALLATGRERALSGAMTGEFNRGTYGLATGGTSTGMMAANPRLEALYNAQRQQDLGLAAQATQGGMDYAKFGAGMVGTGGDLLKQMYGTQTAAYQPYQTAFGGAQTLEGLGQNALEQGINLGRATSNAQSGALLSQGMLNAANTQAGAASSPWAQLLMGAGNTLGQMAAPKQQPYAYDPYTGKPVVWGQG